jgi:broad specificity phosphatase PhoE
VFLYEGNEVDDWRYKAKCRGLDTELWYPPRDKTKYKKILIITHGGVILKLIKLLFNISEINGDYNFTSNCHITYIKYDKKETLIKNLIKNN